VGPRLWNDLPLSLRDGSQIRANAKPDTSFSALLRSYLKAAYYSGLFICLTCSTNCSFGLICRSSHAYRKPSGYVYAIKKTLYRNNVPSLCDSEQLQKERHTFFSLPQEQETTETKIDEQTTLTGHLPPPSQAVRERLNGPDVYSCNIVEGYRRNGLLNLQGHHASIVLPSTSFTGAAVEYQQSRGQRITRTGPTDRLACDIKFFFLLSTIISNICKGTEHT